MALLGCGGGATTRPDASLDGSGRDASGGAATPGNAVWSAWPLGNHDPGNTRRSQHVGPQTPSQRFAVEALAQNLVIGVDGTLYVSLWGDTHPVTAVAATTGERLWSFVPPTADLATAPPRSPTLAAGPEGNLYVAYQQGEFYALDRDGSVRWQFSAGHSGAIADLGRFTSPLVDAQGRVYVGDSSRVYAFENDGRPAWQFDTRSIYAALPAGIGADGTVYVRNEYGPLHALRRDGTLRWTFSLTTAVPAIGIPYVRDDGSLLLALLGERQFGAVDADGMVLWQKPGSFSGLALGADGAPYVADGQGVMRLDREGSTVWQAAAGGYGAIVDAAGTVYSAASGTIAAVDAAGVLTWELRTADPAVPNSALARPALLAIGGDGTLYAAFNGALHAIGGGGLCEGTPAGCDDDDPCTIDRCDPALGCVHGPRCVSPGGCTTARCGPDGVCAFTAAPDETPCDDGIACTDTEACHAGVCTAAASPCGLADGWPMASHDPSRTRATALLGPATPTTKDAVPDLRASTFVISNDGTVLVSDRTAVSSISPTGTVAPFATVPAVDLVLRRDGALYVTAAETTPVLRAFGGGGDEHWTLGTTPTSTPALAPSGAVYVTTRGLLLALAPDGSALWQVPTGGAIAPPALAPDGTVYALGPDLWAVLPDGRIKWKRPVGWARGMVIGPNGTAYVIGDGGVRAIDAEGAERWEWSLERPVPLEPALSGGELLVVAGPAIFRLDASTGEQRSAVTPPAPPGTVQQLVSPVVDGDGVLYVMGNATDADSFQPRTQATIFAIDRSDRILWTAPFNRALNAAGAGLAIGPDRTLYFTVGGTLRAIGP